MAEYICVEGQEQRQRPGKKRRLRVSRLLLVILLLAAFLYGLRLLVYKINNPSQVFFAPGRLSPPAQSRENSRDLLEELNTLFEKNPETYDFVMNYDANRGSLAEIDISGDVADGGIPLFLQWDERWGYDNYGSGMLAVTGCGPTCLSMVAVALTGDLSLNPRTVADFAAENGYYAEGSGTEWTLMTDGAAKLRLNSRVLPLHEPTILAELRAGNPIICSVGSGDFTTEGHYIVLTDVNSDGTVRVNDPNSIIRSEKSWELNEIMTQFKNLWSFSG